MADEEVSIALKADSAKLKAGLDQGKQQVNQFKSNALSAFKAIGPAIAGAFAITKIVSFVKTGIVEFAKWDRVLTQVVKKVAATGESMDGLRESVEGYIRSAEAASRFSKTELAGSLDDLMLKTGDYSRALAINEKAMDLAVAANIPLKTASKALGLAYEGNISGLGQLAMLLGVATEDAKDAEKVFAKLDETTMGVARAEDTLATDLDKLSNSMNDAAEIVGEALGPLFVDVAIPAINLFTRVVQDAVKLVQTLGVFLGSAALQAMSAFEFITDAAMRLKTFLTDVWKGPKEAFTEFTEGLASDWSDHNQRIVDATAITGEELEALWLESAETKNQLDLKALRDALRIKNKDVATDKAAAKVKLSTHQKLLAALAAADKKKRKDDAAAHAKDEALKLQVTKAGFLGAGEALQAFVTSQVAGTMTTREAWSELGKGMFNAVVQALGGALIAEGMIKLAQGAAALLGIATMALAPGLLAGGAMLIAAGAGIQALTLLLAEGGLVTAPTMALVGEAGPEAVIPLDRAAEFGLGPGGAGPITVIVESMEFPGVTSIEELEEGEFAETAGRQLAEGLQDVRNREGGRLRSV